MSFKAYGKSRHLVVDIETLGTAAPAPLLAIGAVCLDASRGRPAVVRTMRLGLDPRACAGAPDADTVLWWNQQAEVVRREAFAGATSTDPRGDFATLIEDFSAGLLQRQSPRL